MTVQTIFEFTLPRGYLDHAGQLHRTGHMRLATAMDEIESVQDPRVQANEAYLPVVLLSRVVVQLGDFTAITPQVIENLFASDLAYLEDVYMRLNSQESILLGVSCPHCAGRFEVQVAPLSGGE
jgi:hypothetical protein